MDNDSMKEETVLLLEPFYGGSHKQLVDTLIDGNIQLILMINSVIVRMQKTKTASVFFPLCRLSIVKTKQTGIHASY